MASRAPLDLRVNTLKAKREKMLGSIAHLGAMPTPWSPIGLRIELGADARNPGIHAEEDFIKGAIEVQDEGSQLAALLSAAKPGEQVIDLCAGAGGKTLALAAMMQGKGRLIATDHDKRQLAPIYERLSRAGVHNADIRTPKGDTDTLADIHASADLVLIDAPCTGTGTWRRNPDAKWRMRPGALEVRLKDQIEVLDRAAALVKPGGRIAYITCSVLPPENGEQVSGFRRPPSGIRGGAAGADRGGALGQGRGFCRGRAAIPGGLADDPAPHRHRRVFRVGAEEAAGMPEPRRACARPGIIEHCRVGSLCIALGDDGQLLLPRRNLCKYRAEPRFRPMPGPSHRVATPPPVAYLLSMTAAQPDQQVDAFGGLGA